MSAERLKNIASLSQEYVDDRRIQGAVVRRYSTYQGGLYRGSRVSLMKIPRAP